LWNSACSGVYIRKYSLPGGEGVNIGQCNFGRGVFEKEEEEKDENVEETGGKKKYEGERS
jgi:hypothetical protein